MRRISLPAAAALTVLALPAVAAAASPPNLQCNGNYSGGTYGNVTVPAGDTCTLSGTTVQGNATALNGATLTLNYSTSKGTVGGNVLVGSGTDLTVSPSWTVGGTIAAQGASILVVSGGTTHDIVSTDTTDLSVSGATIKGNVVANQTQDFGVVGDNPVITGDVTVNATASSAQEFDLDNQLVAGNVYITNNSAPTEIFVNTIRQNLVCTGNTPPPDDFGYGNYVQGRQVGQCAGFANSPGDGVEG